MISISTSQAGEDALRLITSYASSDPRHAVLGAANAIEAYSDTIVEATLDEFRDSGGPLSEALVQSVGSDPQKSWDSRKHWLKTCVGQSVSDGTPWQNAIVLVALRNALAHGTGGLSRLQRSEKDLGRSHLERFKRVFDCEFANGRLLITTDVGSRAMGVAREFVLSIDQKLPSGSHRVRLASLR